MTSLDVHTEHTVYKTICTSTKILKLVNDSNQYANILARMQMYQQSAQLGFVEDITVQYMNENDLYFNGDDNLEF